MMKAIKINKPGEIYVSEIPDAKWKKGYAVIEVKALQESAAPMSMPTQGKALMCLIRW